MRRLIVVIIALAVAITAGLLFLSVAGLAVPATRELAADAGIGAFLSMMASIFGPDGPNPMVAVAVGGFVALLAALLLLPPVLVALVGEVAGLRSYVWYAGGAGVLTMAIAWMGQPAGERLDAADGKIMLLLFLTGAVSGLVYWAIAGRSTGAGASAAV
jgi:hypothetical protein